MTGEYHCEICGEECWSCMYMILIHLPRPRSLFLGPRPLYVLLTGVSMINLVEPFIGIATTCARGSILHEDNVCVYTETGIYLK